MRRDELDLGAAGDETFGRVENLDAVGAIGSHDGYSKNRPPMQVEMTCLSGCHGETSLKLGHDRPYDAALLLEGVHVAEQQVELERPYVHMK